MGRNKGRIKRSKARPQPGQKPSPTLAARLKAILAGVEGLDVEKYAPLIAQVARFEDNVDAHDAAVDDLNAREADLQQSQDDHQTQSERLRVEQEQLKTANHALTEERRELTRVRSEVQKETRNLERLRIESQNNFAQDNHRALAELRESRDTLLRQITDASSRLDELRNAAATCGQEAGEALQAELARQREDAHRRWEAEAERRTQDAETHCEALRQRAQDEVDRLLSNAETQRNTLQLAQEAAWEQREASLNEMATRQQKRLDALNADLTRREELLGRGQLELQNGQAQLQVQQAFVEQQNALMQSMLEKQHRQEMEALQKRLKLASEQTLCLEQQRDGLRQTLRRFGDQGPEQVLANQRELEQTNARLRRELGERLPREAQAELEALRKRFETASEELRQSTQRVAELEAQSIRWRLGVAQLEHERDLREAEEHRRSALQAQIRHLGDEVRRLEGIFANPAEIETRAASIMQPVFDVNTLHAFGRGHDEIQWLNHIETQCVESGLHFPRRLLNAFHTALKTADWSPLTVLAGVSGTGKSALPEMYARFGGLLFQSTAVQPNWDSPQSLFGFFNSVDNLFDATTLLRAMVQMQAPEDNEHSCHDRLLLVLLDEMNLAHIELYFSEMLSRLEQRRGGREVPSFEVSLGAGVSPYRVQLSPNVLWVGTMNEDETTQSLSDKVLDRGNLLSFPRPTRLRRRQTSDLADFGPSLSLRTWRGWQNAANRQPFSNDEIRPFKECVEQVNEHLATVGRAIGHRVWQAAEHYMAHHPEVIAARAALQQSGEGKELVQRQMRLAFEDAVVHKIMPKLRGIETTGRARTHCLDPINALLNDQGLNLTGDYQRACNNPYGAFVWSSADYLMKGEDAKQNPSQES